MTITISNVKIKYIDNWIKFYIKNDKGRIESNDIYWRI